MPRSRTEIERIPFGRTGHQSSRTLFGAAALAAMSQERADRVLETLLEHGVNHIDTAAAYGDSELRIAPWMRRHRNDFFLATKTGERTYAGARDSIRRSLERLGVEQIDLIQLHNLVDDGGWQTALAAGGALEAAVEAREQGLVRFIGVTGHGTRAAEMHRKSLERFAFDSVLLPYNFPMMSDPAYARDFDALEAICRERGIALQTIKSIARRRWKDQPERRFSWYEPLRRDEDIRRAVRYVLSRPGLFLNTSSDATLLEIALDAAASSAAQPSAAEMEALVAQQQMEPLFVRDVSDAI